MSFNLMLKLVFIENIYILVTAVQETFTEQQLNVASLGP